MKQNQTLKSISYLFIGIVLGVLFVCFPLIYMNMFENTSNTTEKATITDATITDATTTDATPLDAMIAEAIDDKRLVVIDPDHFRYSMHLETPEYIIEQQEEYRKLAEQKQAEINNYINSQTTYVASTNSTPAPSASYQQPTGDGVLTASKGVNYGPTGKETYYNLNMNGVITNAKNMGIEGEYWVREDGVKMYGDYVIVAADLNQHPRGSLVESSLGTGIVLDTGGFATNGSGVALDIAVDW